MAPKVLLNKRNHRVVTDQEDVQERNWMNKGKVSFCFIWSDIELPHSFYQFQFFVDSYHSTRFFRGSFVQTVKKVHFAHNDEYNLYPPNWMSS